MRSAGAVIIRGVGGSAPSRSVSGAVHAAYGKCQLAVFELVKKRGGPRTAAKTSLLNAGGLSTVICAAYIPHRGAAAGCEDSDSDCIMEVGATD